MKLQLKYKGVNHFGYPVYIDERGFKYGNTDLVDNNDLSAICLLTPTFEEPLFDISHLDGITEVEITHADGSIDTMSIRKSYTANNIPPILA